MSPRAIHGSGLLLCIASLLIAIYYMEGYLGLEPCPLCVLDRIVIAAMAVLFLLAWLINPRRGGQVFFALLLMVLGLLGVALAGRHIWLQSLDRENLPDCTPALSYMVENFPLLETLSIVLNSSGQCAEVAWRSLSLSIPQQTLIFFIVLLVHVLLILFCRRRPAPTRL